MLIVVAMIAIISTVPIVVMSSAVSQTFQTRQNLYWNGAYEAAEAGVNDYTEQLDQNENFAQYISTNRSFSCTFNFAPTPLPTPPATPLFAGGSRSGTSTTPPEWYEYALPSTATEALTLTVSGKAGTGASAVIRTFTYNLAPASSFLDNIYWSNYEMSDPTLPGSS